MRTIDLGGMIFLGPFPSNVNTGVLVVRNASLARAILTAPRGRGEGWEQAIANDVLRSAVGAQWTQQPLPARVFVSHCFKHGRRLDRVVSAALTPSGREVRGDWNPERECAANGSLAYLCAMATLHAACATNNASADLNLATNQAKLSKVRRPVSPFDLLNPLGKWHLLEGINLLRAACRPTCEARGFRDW